MFRLAHSRKLKWEWLFIKWLRLAIQANSQYSLHRTWRRLIIVTEDSFYAALRVTHRKIHCYNAIKVVTVAAFSTDQISDQINRPNRSNGSNEGSQVICQFKSRALIWIDYLPRISNNSNNGNDGGWKRRLQGDLKFANGEWRFASRRSSDALIILTIFNHVSLYHIFNSTPIITALWSFDSSRKCLLDSTSSLLVNLTRMFKFPVTIFLTSVVFQLTT